MAIELPVREDQRDWYFARCGSSSIMMSIFPAEDGLIASRSVSSSSVGKIMVSECVVVSADRSSGVLVVYQDPRGSVSVEWCAVYKSDSRGSVLGCFPAAPSPRSSSIVSAI